MKLRYNNKKKKSWKVTKNNPGNEKGINKRKAEREGLAKLKLYSRLWQGASCMKPQDFLWEPSAVSKQKAHHGGIQGWRWGGPSRESKMLAGALKQLTA